MAMSRLSPLAHSRSRSSLLSDTTYHSFQDVELFEPVVSSSPSSASTTAAPSPATKEAFTAFEMTRQDSGYESIGPPPSKTSRRRTSTTSSTASRPRKRPSVRRSTKSGPVSHLPRGSLQSLHLTQSYPTRPPPGFFHFPSPGPMTDDEQATSSTGRDSLSAFPYGDPADPAHDQQPGSPTSPQTTYYWTSDRTRRLEYAAIDAASRGVKGWMMRHMPDCFVPKEQRRVGFDDDTGSVRRYRLDLETEESAEMGELAAVKRRKAWFWSSA